MKKKCCLSFGKCNKKFWALIVSALIIDVVFIILIIYFFYSAHNIDINFLMEINMLPYLFMENLCQSFMIIPHLIFKKMNTSKERDSFPRTTSINYIFNKNQITFSFRDKIYLIFFLFLKLFTDVYYITYLIFVCKISSFNKELTYVFYFQLIFLFLLSKLFYKKQYYKHQYISIAILTIFEFISFFFQFVSGSVGSFFFNLHCHIVYSFLKSSVTVYIKGLMEYKYYSPYKTCFIFGFVNLIIIALVYLIASFFPCDGELCLEIYNMKRYFGNFLSLLNTSIFIMLLFFTLKSIVLILNYVIINEFSVCHSFLILQLSQKLETTITASFFFGDDTYDNITVVLIYIFFILNVFFILVFLEIIEINRCNCNYNIKKSIALRAETEVEFDDLNSDNTLEESFINIAQDD